VVPPVLSSLVHYLAACWMISSVAMGVSFCVFFFGGTGAILSEAAGAASHNSISRKVVLVME